MAPNVFSPRSLGITTVAVLAVSLVALRAGQSSGAAVPMDSDDIAGVVSGANGPEAGVWVIAETRDLPTRHIKIVVTDDEGRYLIPDLPHATYDVWVRGYGLVDSEKVQAEPGATLNLTAVVAPDARAAAQYYPAQYWFALLQLPAPSEFPGTGLQGNGISPSIESQGGWIRSIVSTDGCIGCHALGNKATREIPGALGDFDSHVDAWERRVQSGQAGREHGHQVHPGWARTRACDVRRLERSHRSGRVSDDTSPTAARYRAQRGRQFVGLGRPPCVHARPDLC